VKVIDRTYRKHGSPFVTRLCIMQTSTSYALDRTAYCDVIFHGPDFKVVGNFVAPVGKVRDDALLILFMKQCHMSFWV